MVIGEFVGIAKCYPVAVYARAAKFHERSIPRRMVRKTHARDESMLPRYNKPKSC